MEIFPDLVRSSPLRQQSEGVHAGIFPRTQPTLTIADVSDYLPGVFSRSALASAGSATESHKAGRSLELGSKKAYDRRMAEVHITEAELARDVHAVLEKVQKGAEVVIEQDHRPVAVMKAPPAPGRSIDECIALAKAYEEGLGLAPVPDPDFDKDVQAAIDAHREPLDTSAWD